MNLWAGLLADVDRARVRELARGFENPTNYDSGQILFVVGIVVVASALVAVIVAVVRRQLAPRPGDYLAQAGRMLGLSRLELHDLRRTAERAGLRHPASMLLSPENLTEAVRLAGAGGEYGGLSAAAAEGLAQKLFDVPLPTDPGQY